TRSTAFSRYLKIYLISPNMAAFLSLDEFDMVQLAPQFTRYKQPVARAVVSYSVKLIVVIRFVRINANQVDLPFNGTGFGVNDHDDVFRIYVSIYFPTDILQFVETIQRPLAVVNFDKPFLGVCVFVEKIEAAGAVRFDQPRTVVTQPPSFLALPIGKLTRFR